MKEHQQIQNQPKRWDLDLLLMIKALDYHYMNTTEGAIEGISRDEKPSFEAAKQAFVNLDEQTEDKHRFNNGALMEAGKHLVELASTYEEAKAALRLLGAWSSHAGKVGPPHPAYKEIRFAGIEKLIELASTEPEAREMYDLVTRGYAQSGEKSPIRLRAIAKLQSFSPEGN